MPNVLTRMKTKTPFVSKPDDGVIVCRCEEVTKGEIRKALHDGLKTMGEVKRLLRCGMGLCQGQSCQRLVISILAQELGEPPASFGKITGRAPARPIAMEVLATSGADLLKTSEGAKK